MFASKIKKYFYLPKEPLLKRGSLYPFSILMVDYKADRREIINLFREKGYIHETFSVYNLLNLSLPIHEREPNSLICQVIPMISPSNGAPRNYISFQNFHYPSYSLQRKAKLLNTEIVIIDENFNTNAVEILCGDLISYNSVSSI